MSKPTEVINKRYDVQVKQNEWPDDSRGQRITMMACAGTEYGSEFEASEFVRSLGIDVKDGDEVTITVRVTQRIFVERRPPTD